MVLVAYLFRATLLLWGIAIAAALAGHAFDQDWLTGMSLGLRRLAPALTLVWLLTAFGRMIWLRFWPFQRRKR
ncbi:MAG: hypothetical protein M3464_10425 [Chloroflexota bacterium]|nr:hypothetical protein [Chloroflexota bacterium]